MIPDTTEMFYCPLTEDDRAAVEAVRHDEEAKIGMLAMRKKRITERIAERTKEAEAKALLATGILRAGAMDRKVRPELDAARGIMRLHRVDTGEFVGTRALTTAERQGRLL